MSTEIVCPQTGIAEIDAEHAGLLDCLNRLQRFAGHGHGFAASLDAVLTLKDYATAHFAHEEAYLQQRGFPGLAEHIEQHQAITRCVDKLYGSVLDGEEIEMSLVDMMRSWIVKHIGVEDMEFAMYFGTATASAPV